MAGKTNHHSKHLQENREESYKKLTSLLRDMELYVSRVHLEYEL